MDLKGFQYHGTIHAGPTVLIGSMIPSKDGRMIKVDCVTDEFCSIKKTGDVMAQLEAVVEGDMDESYQIREDNVNLKSKDSPKDHLDTEGDNNLKRKQIERKQPSKKPSSKKNRLSKS